CFAQSWAWLAAGVPARDVARAATSRALAAARLGDLDAATLAAAGIPPDAVRAIRHRAVTELADPLDPALRSWLLEAAEELPSAPAPGFVGRLALQPRAGVTCPGRGRLVLEPPENHAEHSTAVAVAGVLLAPAWSADPVTVFVAGLAHHLHNALLPDSGFAGEMLLGEWLAPAMARAREIALDELGSELRETVESACRILPDAATAEGRAFQAADTIDRVLQVEHHLRAARTTMGFVQRQMGLVHDGPTKPFQDAVLARMDLAS
ncbi:MAG: hypothetical protein JOZ42_15810, partial [Acetobacteraceae bacterium]|nr:hypothetical protein [Acetobacteraceae bacterium]